ncbi:hypothetical protein [Secundilactobacillus malefermentans]|uniref:Uncharacterized protein n=1 Tax=Secundilactobacillus malefermentans TaxID=176292 RepID=A0A4R5NM16_9LACO|nr:hypothetical protein [Secundilactobacillus malefermentans]KRM57677.1 hypothetical protein FD44_GL001046 [Secundilactobacillus malefermentans DSM 5705 = KCTC 3548]QEA31264.1 hypothetical protein FGL90_03245 [Secundilactobacillus malefermentans]TDG76638.1 hypothetical protein C5L31_000191 [Secundilactobacillus malefermentans]
MKKYVNSYLAGLIPFLIIVGLAGFTTTKAGDFIWRFTWMMLYFTISYFAIYPYVVLKVFPPGKDGMLDVNQGNMSTTEPSSTLGMPSPTINNREFGIKPHEPTAKYVKDSKVNMLASGFTIRLIIILFSPVFLLYYLIKRVSKK